jgi:hypothetical protein
MQAACRRRRAVLLRRGAVPELEYQIDHETPLFESIAKGRERHAPSKVCIFSRLHPAAATVRHGKGTVDHTQGS